MSPAPAPAAPRDLFVTACRVLTYHDRAALRAELLARGALGDGDGRRLDDNPLAWALALAEADPPRFDRFWRLVEDQHAADRAADAASPQP